MGSSARVAIRIADIIDVSAINTKCDIDDTILNMKSARPYDMTNRAAAAAETAERIVAAAMSLMESTPLANITLVDIAGSAGATVQTVLRRFGDRDSVFAAAAARFALDILAQRAEAEAGDVEGAVSTVIDHYERHGALVLKMIAEQSASIAVQALIEGGADYHRDWCAKVFADSLSGLSDTERNRRLAQFTVICDVRTWQLLRRGGNLSRAQTQMAMLEMLYPLTKSRG